jgi:hypothetical protein
MNGRTKAGVSLAINKCMKDAKAREQSALTADE